MLCRLVEHIGHSTLPPTRNSSGSKLQTILRSAADDGETNGVGGFSDSDGGFFLDRNHKTKFQ